MSTIHMHQTTTSTPEQFLAAVIDFGPGWSKVFGNSADEFLKVHHLGSSDAGDSSERGAVDPYLRLFGQPGLHVMDGSVMPANPGVNPSLMITALTERAMSLWPNKGDADRRPPLGSSYERVDPVMPHRPFVPAGAPGELRLDAKKSDIIPEYPY